MTALLIAAVVLLLLIAAYFPLHYFLGGAHQLAGDDTPEGLPRPAAVSDRAPRLDAATRLGSNRPRLSGLPERVVGLGSAPRKTAAKGFRR